MNFTLLKSTFRNNWTLLVIFTSISLAYLLMIISMYNPENLKAIEVAIQMIQPGLAAAVGMDKIPLNLTDFAANYFYGFLIQLFLLVHVILLPIRLVVKEVDDGSMAYLLSTPNSRTVVVGTRAIYMAVSLFVMVGFMTVVSMLVSEVLFPGDLDIPAFLSLNLATYLTALAMASIVFFFSCIFNTSRAAISWGSAILIGFFILSLVGRYGHFSGIYGILAKFSIFRFLQAREIISGQINLLTNDLWLGFIAACFTGSGIFIFKKRNLPL